MKKIFVIQGIALVALACLLTFFYVDQSTKVDRLKSELAVLTEDNAVIKKTLDGCLGVIEEQETRVTKLKNQYDVAMYYANSAWEAAQILQREAPLIVGEKKFNIVASQGALMSVSFESIKNQAAGCDILLEFVNFYSVSLSDIDVTITYSKENPVFDQKLTPEENKAKYDDFIKYKKEKTERINLALPATSTHLKVFIPDYKSDEIKYISVSINSQGIRYRKQ